MAAYILPQFNHVDGQRYVIYGTGEVAVQYYNQLRQRYGVESIAFFLNSDPSQAEFNGVRLLKPEEIRQYEYMKYKYILTSFASMQEMIDILVSLGIEESQIIRAAEPPANLYLRNDISMLKNILYYPEVRTEEELSKLFTRIRWYIPASGEISTTVNIASSIQTADKPKNVNMMSAKSGDIQAMAVDSDIILVWNKDCLTDSLIKEHRSKVYCVDETFYSTIEACIYYKIYYCCLSLENQNKYDLLSKYNYKSMYNQNMGKREANVFGTGPSLESAYNFDFDNCFNIACNSMVKNKKLLGHINPDLLVFADPVFHFSPCEYASRFRDDVIDTVKEFDCYVLIPSYTVPLILEHYPELENRIIGMPIQAEYFNFPTEENFNARSSSNILTLFMIPVASAIVDDINILGCDGRQQNETYFWKHNDSTQYSDLMKTVFEMHPSFFRDRVYEDYYDEHCKYLGDLISYGESKGKRYHSITFSYIPALKSREKAAKACSEGK